MAILQEDQVKEAWEAGSGDRRWMSRLWEYYRGRQEIPELMISRLDGRQRSKILTNWTKYVIRMHSGFLLYHPVNYSLPVGDEDTSGLEELQAVYQANHVSDMSLLADAILYGSGIEVAGYDSDREVMTLRRYSPLNWRFLRDQAGNIVEAIYRTEIEKGTIFDGEYQTADRVLFYVYDESDITIFEEVKEKRSDGGIPNFESANRNGSQMGTPKNLRLIETKSHAFAGRLPITVFEATDDGESFLTEAFLTQCDIFDISRSSLADDIRHNVDSFLKLRGIDPAPLMQTDEAGVTVMQRMRELGILPLKDADADAEYISRDVNVDKFRYDHKVTRASIHLMGAVPDLDETIGGNEGTITNISGIALKLMFHNMIQQSAEFAENFERGLRHRVELMNDLNAKRSRPLFENFSIKFNRNLPLNDVELMQVMPNLDGVISRLEKLKLLPFIADPERSLRELEDEMDAEEPETPPGPGRPASFMAVETSEEGAN